MTMVKEHQIFGTDHLIDLSNHRSIEECGLKPSNIVVNGPGRRSSLKLFNPQDINVCTKSKSYLNLPVPNIEELTKETLSRAHSPEEELHPKLKRKPSEVSFQEVIIREYDQTLGDNPSTCSGPPVTLGWDYQQYMPINVDLYEMDRGNRRNLRQMFINGQQRKNALIHLCGHSVDEVDKVLKEGEKIRSQRFVTKIMLPFSRIEDAIESSGRKLNRMLSSKRKNHKKPSGSYSDDFDTKKSSERRRFRFPIKRNNTEMTIDTCRSSENFFFMT